MRTIRTDYSYTREQVPFIAKRASLAHKRFPGFSLVWCGSQTNQSLDLSRLSSIGVHPELLAGDPQYLRDAERFPSRDWQSDILHFLDISVEFGGTNAASNMSELIRRNPFRPGVSSVFLKNSEIVNGIFDSGLVVERSPPEWLPLKSVLQHAPTATALGTYIGIYSITGNNWLMMISIPMGVIIMGAAVGVSKGLSLGLQHKIESLFKSNN